MMMFLLRNVRNRLAGQPAATLLMCWAGVWVGAFTLVGTKLPSYIMPAYPALALGFGALVDHWLAQPSMAECRRWLRSAWATTAVVGLGICIVVPIVTHYFLAGEWTPALVGLVPLAGAIVGWRFMQQQNAARSLQTLAVAAVLFGVGLLSFAVLPIDAHQNSERFATKMRRMSNDQPHVAAISYSPPSLIYYTGTPITKVDTAEQIVEFFNQHSDDAYLVTTAKTLENLTGHLPEGLRVIDRDKRFLRKGEIVVLGRREEPQVARRLKTVRE
jgi:4-amino-4-deoxy-L-arabinose transferase-like glycosyltransferase